MWSEGDGLQTVRRARTVITVDKLKRAATGIERAPARLEDGGGACRRRHRRQRAVKVGGRLAARARGGLVT